jgi:hypothetical protein
VTLKVGQSKGHAHRKLWFKLGNSYAKRGNLYFIISRNTVFNAKWAQS